MPDDSDTGRLLVHLLFYRKEKNVITRGIFIQSFIERLNSYINKVSVRKFTICESFLQMEIQVVME